jgi:hypothetical protein
MTPTLLDLAIAAHGGLDRWNAFRTISAEMSVGGALWDLKGQTGLFADSLYEADTHTQRVTLARFGRPGRRVRFTPDRLVLEEDTGQEIEVRNNPRDAFIGHSNGTPWDLLHAAYFDAYALWTYLTQPFLFSYPGFTATEIEPWEEDGETWRRLRVIFPDRIASHTREQVIYFGSDGLTRRHDYAVDVLGGSTGANYSSRYKEFDGIMVPTRRRIHPIAPTGRREAEPVLVSIDIRSVDFR